MFSVGTLFGLGYTPDNPSTYKVKDNVVVYDDERTKTRPGTFMLPSLCLGAFHDRSISAIVPVNFNLGTQVDLGLGLSVGIHKGGRQDEKKEGGNRVCDCGCMERFRPAHGTANEVLE